MTALTAEMVKQAYAREAQDGIPPALLRTDVPSRYEAITAAWLTDVLCAATPGAEVDRFELTDRDDGSSNRRRIKLTYNAAGQSAGLPASVFCKAAESLGNRIILGPTGTAQAEVDFYDRVRARLAIEAPVGIHGRCDTTNGAYLLMMQDLGGRATFCDHRTKIDETRAAGMMRTLAQMHATFYEHPDLGTAAIPMKHWSDWWEQMMVVSPDFGAACDLGFGMAKAAIPKPLFQRRDDIWLATTRSVERHRALPRTLIHGDVHTKNWYITNDNVMGLADWHICAVGHWSRDVAYVLGTALTIEDRRAWENGLLQIYLDRFAELGAPRCGADEAWANIRQQLFSVLAFWTITLRPAADMPAMQREDLTYALIERIAAMMDDHKAIDAF